jgi:gliding motility-associated-like protein
MDVWTVRVTDGIASADINLSVTIHALPSGTITAAQTVLCGNNGTVTLTASGGDTYRWFLEGVQIPGTASQLAISQTGNYTATIVSVQGCSAPATGTVAITRLQAPVAQFSFSNYCINQPVQFTNQSTVNNSGTVSYQWSDNNAHSSTATSPVFTYGQTGAFDVKLKVIPQSCPAIADSVIKTITIVTAVPGIRLPTVDASKNTLTQLHARTQSGATYNWAPGNYLTSPFIADPQVFTRVQQEYKILVTAPGGCITTDTLLVRVQAASAIYVPNVFTPNGDGQNDLLLPTTVATIKALRFFRVFNRWGKMLFETTQKGKGWDGRYNGQLQPLDTYTWVIEGVDENGTIIKKQGSVTLLR